MSTIFKRAVCSIIALLFFMIFYCGISYADTVSYDASGEDSNVTVTLNSNEDNGYDVIVSGTGKMKDYTSEMVFQLLGKTIHTVTVQEGVTYIGAKFLTCTVNLNQLKEIHLPESLEGIGQEAFNRCGNVNKIVIPENVKSIGTNAFALDMLAADRNITIKGLNTSFDSTTFQIQMPFGAGKNIFTIYKGGETEQSVANYLTATINKKDVFRFDNEDQTKIVEYCADMKTVMISDEAKVISSDAFQNDNGKAIVSLDLNKVEKVEDNAFKGISTLKTIYAYNAALGQDGALGEGSFANLPENITVYYKGEDVKTALINSGISEECSFIALKPYKTAAAVNISRTVETGTEEELDLNGMFDALYDTTLIETYTLKKSDSIIGSGNCESHKYLFKAETAGEYELSFKAKDSDNLESEDVYKVTYTVLDNKAPYIKVSSKHSKIRALVKNQYSFDLQPIFMDDDEGDQLTYYYTRDLSKDGMKTSSTFNSNIAGFSPTKVSEKRAIYQQFLAEEEHIYFYAVDRFGKKSELYTLTVIPHSCSLEITANDPDDLKGVTKKMIKIADDTEIEPVETVNGVAYYDLDDLESYKYVVRKKGFKTVEQEFIQNQLEDNINWKGMAYTVALEKDADYDSAAVVDALIDAIGEVELTDESKAAIKTARDAYDGLNDVAKSLVEKYDKLMIAEKTIEVLQKEADLISAQNDLQSAKEKLNKALGNDTPEEDINNLIGQVEQAKADLADAQNNLMSALEKLNEALNNEVSIDDIDKLIGQINHIKAELINAQNELELANKDKQASADEITALKGKLAALELKVKGFKVTSKGRKFTVKWKKNAKADGYRVQYKLSGAKKFKTLKTLTKTKTVTNKLKKGKKYEFRVATYKKVNGKKVFGKWTEAKIVKCK